MRLDRGVVSIIERGSSELTVGQARGEPRPIAEAIEPQALTPRDHQTALSLLECAAKALEILYDRRDQLEAALEDVSTRAEGAVAAAQAQVIDWQRLANGLRSDAQDAERRLDAMKQRAERAESQVEAERGRADTAERRAAEALQLSQGLHSKIISVFGRESTVHKALLVAVDETPAG